MLFFQLRFGGVLKMKSTEIRESLTKIMEEEGLYPVKVQGDKATWGEIGYFFNMKISPIGESRKFKVLVEGTSRDKDRSNLNINLIFATSRGKIYESGFYTYKQAKEIFTSAVKEVRQGGLRNILENFCPMGAGMSLTDLIDLYRDPR